MALNTYAALKTAIANWLNRSDLSDEIADDFIKLTEADFNSKLRIRQMEQIDTITIDSETETVPTGFIGVRSFYILFTNESNLSVTSSALELANWPLIISVLSAATMTIGNLLALNKIIEENSPKNLKAVSNQVKITNKDESSMRKYKWDEQFYKEIVKDSEFSYGKFNESNYPLHLQQH